MCFKIMLKDTKNQGFILFLEDTFLEKPQGRVKLTGLRYIILMKTHKKLFKLSKSWPRKG